MTQHPPRTPTANSTIAYAGGAFVQTSTRKEFGIGLGVAVALHILLMLAAVVDGRTARQRMGEKDASPEAISVDIIDASELLPQGGGAQQTQRQPSTPVTTDDKPAATATDQPQQKLEDAAEPLPQNGPGKSMSKSAAEHPVQKKKQKSDASAGQAANLGLDLTIPTMPTTSAVTRPLGITRSGENDEFGRGVVRALRQTMPTAKGTAGRVTVRIFLNEAGNLLDVRLVQSSGNTDLDQQVLFAVRLSSFPIPPTGSTAADRTFLVSYLYR